MPLTPTSVLPVSAWALPGKPEEAGQASPASCPAPFLSLGSALTLNFSAVQENEQGRAVAGGTGSPQVSDMQGPRLTVTPGEAL